MLRIANINPNNGPSGGGYQITITGEDFPPDVEVRFNAAIAVIHAPVLPGSITVTVPNLGPGLAAVTVENPRTHEAPQSGFTYNAPVITGIAPGGGAVAAATPNVVITGTNFSPQAVVTFDVTPVAPVARGADFTSITATAPAHIAGDIQVTVANPGGAQAQRVFRHVPIPTVNAVAPNQSREAGGRNVTITGADFDPAATVYVNNVAATNPVRVNATTITATVPRGVAGAANVEVRNPFAQHSVANVLFTYTAAGVPPVSRNQVGFLMDDAYFDALADGFDDVIGENPHPQTYIRLAFFKASESCTLSTAAHHNDDNRRLEEYIRQVIVAGHNIDIILWYPNWKDRRASGYAYSVLGGGIANTHDAFARMVMQHDERAAAAVAPAIPPGQVRIYLERYEGWTGSSNHEKMAIFSIQGIRTAIVGGFNLSPEYMDTRDHWSFNDHNGQACANHWHDTAVSIVGPATDDIEQEWVRRWQRAVDMQASRVTLNNVPNQVRSRYTGVGTSNTIRRTAVAMRPPNTTPQPTPAGANAEVTISLTRSVRSERTRELRDRLFALINGAQNYIYMENCQISDPELVQRLYAAMGRHVRVVVVTNLGGKQSQDATFEMRSGTAAPGKYLTRRSWLQLALRLPAVAGAAGRRTCTRIMYDWGYVGTNNLLVDNDGTWAVHDCYNPASPKSPSWLEDDTVTVTLPGGARRVIPFSRIAHVETDFHFYTAMRRGNLNGVVTSKSPTIHSKLAIIDDRHLIVGSANFTYRSMQYDGEMTAFVDAGAAAPNVATTSLQALLRHYQPDPPTQLLLSNAADNIDLRALANQAIILSPAGVNGLPNHYVLIRGHFPPFKPPAGITAMPNHTWL